MGIIMIGNDNPQTWFCQINGKNSHLYSKNGDVSFFIFQVAFLTSSYKEWLVRQRLTLKIS